MRSPDFCCPNCGSRVWYREKERWVCRHTAPEVELTEFRSWLEYQFESESETLGLLASNRDRKREKAEAGRAALVETLEIGRLEVRLKELQGNIRLGLLLEALADLVPVGEVRLEEPILRFGWTAK